MAGDMAQALAESTTVIIDPPVPEIDEQLEKDLERIKLELGIWSTGHTETIRQLVDRFKQYRTLETLLNRKLGEENA